MSNKMAEDLKATIENLRKCMKLQAEIAAKLDHEERMLPSSIIGRAMAPR